MPHLPQTNYKSEAGVSNPKDRCQTPSYAVPPILPLLKELEGELGRMPVAWESAAGEGLLAGYLQVYGYPVIATELLDGIDYFGYEPEQYDVQVTNVPFSLTEAWMGRACLLGKPFCLLAPSAFFWTKGWATIRKTYGGVRLLSPGDGVRIDFKMVNQGWEGAGAQFHSSWYVRGFSPGELVTPVTINKPPKKRRKSDGKLVYNPEDMEAIPYEIEGLF